MPRSREEVKVGLVVILAGILLLASLVFVGGGNLLRKKKVTYTTYFKFAGGIEPGGPVRFGGLEGGGGPGRGIVPRASPRLPRPPFRSAQTPVPPEFEARGLTLGV